MSHGDRVETAATGFTAVAQSANAPLARWWMNRAFLRRAVPSRGHAHACRASNAGRFVREICGCEPLWRSGNIIDDAIARVRAQVGKAKCCSASRPAWILGVAAAAPKAIGISWCAFSSITASLP